MKNGHSCAERATWLVVEQEHSSHRTTTLSAEQNRAAILTLWAHPALLDS